MFFTIASANRCFYHSLCQWGCHIPCQCGLSHSPLPFGEGVGGWGILLRVYPPSACCGSIHGFACKIGDEVTEVDTSGIFALGKYTYHINSTSGAFGITASPGSESCISRLALITPSVTTRSLKYSSISKSSSNVLLIWSLSFLE